MIAGLLAVTLPLVGFHLVAAVAARTRSSITTRHIGHLRAGRGVAFALGYAAGEAANRRGDARVFSVAGIHGDWGFMGLHAFGTAGVLFSESRAGFPDRDSGRAARERILRCGLGVRRCAARARAVADAPPQAARGAVLFTMAVWFLWTS